jgi:hypothetical protein
MSTADGTGIVNEALQQPWPFEKTILAGGALSGSLRVSLICEPHQRGTNLRALFDDYASEPRRSRFFQFETASGGCAKQRLIYVRAVPAVGPVQPRITAWPPSYVGGSIARAKSRRFKGGRKEEGGQQAYSSKRRRFACPGSAACGLARTAARPPSLRLT